MMTYYLIGIKGSGMSALAVLLKDLNNEVKGYDDESNYFTSSNLENNNIYSESKITYNQDYHYIVSKAYIKEYNYLQENNYNVSYYNDFIGKLEFPFSIAVSGTHGKTTTTSIISHLLKNEASYIIGDGTGKGLKNSKFFIYEACEYRNSFLKYNPDYLIITNIDYDHPDFFNSIDDIISSFQKLASQSKIIVANGDDSNIRKLNSEFIIYFGFNKNNDIVITEVDDSHIHLSFINKTFYIPNNGTHFIYNATAAIIMSYVVGNKIIDLKNYKLPLRRLNEINIKDNVIIDDYAHHPKEIEETLKYYKKKYHDRKQVLIFQPHTNTRTITLLQDFIKSLKLSDYTFIDKTFPSKREINLNIDYTNLLINEGKFEIFSIDKITEFLNKDNIIIFMGAGDVNKHIPYLLKYT